MQKQVFLLVFLRYLTRKIFVLSVCFDPDRCPRDRARKSDLLALRVQLDEATGFPNRLTELVSANHVPTPSKLKNFKTNQHVVGRSDALA